MTYMNKKVGIITFHKAHNYGAVLQAYALKKMLKNLNAEVTFLDFDNEALDKNYRLFPSLKNEGAANFLKLTIKTLLDFPRKKQRHIAFNSFITKYLDSTNISKTGVNLDCVFLGSDQIWNPNITGYLDPVFFGQHHNIDSTRTVSYAASMGNGMTEDNINNELKRLISCIDSVGVREKSLKLTLESNLGVSCHQNLDPTLLLSKDDWDEISDENDKNENKYILVYEVEKHQSTDSIIQYIKSKTGYNVKVVSSKTSHHVSKSSITTASPKEFISLFKNASFVVTTSFHGTVFSIIYNIPFYTLKFGTGVDNRSSGLLSALELTGRHIKGVDEILPSYGKIEFDKVNSLLEDQRKASLQFIRDNLSNSILEKA